MKAVLEQVAGKGKGHIIYQLMPGTKRFQELEGDGIVARKDYAVFPPKVECSLTEKRAPPARSD
ncbi:MAG: winged helix-turn-helix transcriptional regulator [Pseudomonadota bacterium]